MTDPRMSGVDPDNTPLGTVVEVEVTSHAPWGLLVRLLAPSSSADAAVNRTSIWDNPAGKTQSDYPPVGQRRPAVVFGFTPDWELRLSVRPSDVEMASGPWGVWKEGRITLLSGDQGGLPAGIHSGSSWLHVQFPAAPPRERESGARARIYALDGGDLLPGAVDVPVRIQFWAEAMSEIAIPGTRFLLEHECPPWEVERHHSPVGNGLIVTDG
jgi:hypothetical protein